MITEYGAVLWVDPGGMTGLARIERGRFFADEYEPMEACDRIAAMCFYWRHAMAIGWERFTITADTHKKSRQPEAMEIIGVCKWLAHSYKCQVLPPAQQHTPDRYDRQRLQTLGWWTPGKDDAQSASAHMLNWMLRSGNVPSLAAGKLAAARSGGR